MIKPVIGITSFSVQIPSERSAVSQQYIDAVAIAGGAPICIPMGLDEESWDAIFSTLDGVLLPGGDDVDPARYDERPHPHLGNVDLARDDLELAMATRALALDVPILGICRGIQVLAVAGGGTLYQDLPTQWRSALRHEVREYGRDHLAHTIDVEPDSHLASILGCTTAQVNSFHHQAVKDMPSGLVVSARSPDGVIEGIEAPGERFVMGIQCHPEELWRSTAPEFSRLFTAFVEAGRKHALQHAAAPSRYTHTQDLPLAL